MAITDRRGASVGTADPPAATTPSSDLAIKTPCRIATTANIALTGLQTIDGVTLAAGDRVLVWQQTDQTTNGIYSASTGVWTRATDANNNSHWVDGIQVFINFGTLYAGRTFACTAADPITLGSTSITFAAETALGFGSYTVGDMLYAASSSTLARLAAVAVGSVLISAGVGVAPAWSVNPTLSTLWVSKTVTALPADAGGGTQSVNLFRVVADNVDAGTGFIIGTQRRHIFGGSSTKGGRIAGYDFVANTAATSAASLNRNYVGTVSIAYSAVGDGGSDTSTNAKGAYFGANPFVHLDTGCTNAYFAGAFEADITISTGATVRYAACGLFAGFNAVRGTEVDCAIAIGGGTHIGWKHGILFSDFTRATTENPFYAGSTIVGTYWQAGGGGVPAVTGGIDFGDGSTTGFNFSSFAFRSKGFLVNGSGNVSIGTAGSALGSLTLAGNTSGSTILQPTAAASGTLTLPAATDTLVGKATTDTLTNKTLTSPTITGGTGAGLGKVTHWNGGYVAGRYYSFISGGTGTGAFVVNTAYFTPFVVGETHTFDRIAIEVTTTGTAVSGRLAIYNIANGVPTSLVVDGGTVAVGTTGTKTVTISQSLAPGVYALALVFDGGVTITAMANSQMGTWFFWGTSTLVGASIDSLVAATMTFGAFPASAFTGAMGAITYTAFVSPLIALRA